MFGRRCRLLFTALPLIPLFACSNDSVPTAPSASEPVDLKAAVAALGFDPTGMVDAGSYVIVEGDISIPKARLQGAPMIKGSGITPKLQYLAAGGPVGYPKVQQIKVDLSALNGNAWQAAAQDALDEWNNVSGSYVKIVEGSSADIVFSFDCIGGVSSGVVAEAQFAGSGLPGSWVHINSCYNSSQTSAQRLHNMVHELGHSLGFRHSNCVQHDADNCSGATQITGTPTSGNDNNSVMNGGTALGTGLFSTYDLVAIRAVYPLPGPSVSVTNSGGHPLISWSAPVGANGSYSVNYNLHEHDFYYDYGEFDYDYPEDLGSTSNLSILDAARSYTGTSYCVYNPNGTTQITEDHTYTVTAYYPNGSGTTTVAAPVC